MKGVDTLGLASHFDAMGYPCWKVLMEVCLQANDLDVWRVTNEGVKNGTKREKQFDVIAKSIPLLGYEHLIPYTAFSRTWRIICNRHIAQS
jgi:hypothetical protein